MRYIECLILLIIFYAVAAVQTHKRTKKWLMPWDWASGIMKSLFGSYKILHISEKYKQADDAYWYPSESMIKEITPKIYQRLEEDKYTSKNYQKNRNDCDDYTVAGMLFAHDIFLEKTANLDIKDKAFPIFPFSFERSDNGKRHRLFFIVDNNEKKWYIDSWIIKDKNHTKDGLFRLLDEKEEENGYIPW